MQLSSEQRAALSSSKSGVRREVGYVACMDAAYQAFRFAFFAATFPGDPIGPVQTPMLLTGEERKETLAFALRCVGIMANGPRISGPRERFFAKLIRDTLARNILEQPFKVELTRLWDRPALQNALRARNVFEEHSAGVAAGLKKVDKLVDKKTAADRAKHGLRWCALPCCAKQEACVFDFKECSACKAVVYCSAEHGALHWTATHKKECAALKAAGAKPRSTADMGEGGAGAA